MFRCFVCVCVKRGRRHDDEGGNLLGESGRSRMCGSLPGFELARQISDRHALLPSKQIGCFLANHFPCGCTSLIALVAERRASVVAHICRYPPHLVPNLSRFFFVFSLKMLPFQVSKKEKSVPYLPMFGLWLSKLVTGMQSFFFPPSEPSSPVTPSSLRPCTDNNHTIHTNFITPGSLHAPQFSTSIYKKIGSSPHQRHHLSELWCHRASKLRPMPLAAAASAAKLR